MRTRLEMQLAASVGTAIGVIATAAGMLTAMSLPDIPIWVGLPIALTLGGALGWYAPEIAKRYARWRADVMEQEQEAHDDRHL